MTRPPELPPEPPVPELSSLPRELDPPASLEDRVVAAIGQHALAGDRRRLRWWQIAAAVALFATGAAAGRLTGPEGSAPALQPRFLLLLLAGPNDGPEAERVAAYREWAIAERNAGRQISGERLAAEGLVVERDRPGDAVRDDVQGFFIVSAANLDEAAALARSSPHVRAGGRVIVRPIDTP
jgi:hypothetical protein